MSLRNKVFLCRGDITKIGVDAIVNAANKSLLGGGGVDGAIHRAAGSMLLQECKELGGCDTGEAKITHAYNISQIRAIIHTVGPNIFGKVDTKSRTLLSNCYRNSLEIAKNYKLSSIAFPCISTGVYSYPNDEAAKVALFTVKKWLETGDNASKINAVVFMVFLEKDYKLYREYLPEIFPSSDPTGDDKEDIFDFERNFNEDERKTMSEIENVEESSAADMSVDKTSESGEAEIENVESEGSQLSAENLDTTGAKSGEISTK